MKLRADDAAVRGVILTGAGDKAFIAGADISELFARATAFEAEESSRFGQAGSRSRRKSRQAGDRGRQRLCARWRLRDGDGLHASGSRWSTAKFGQPEVALGLVPGGGGTQRLPRLVGKGRALQLILSGEMISAQEAHRIGLVNEVVPAADLIARAEAILKKIASNAPHRRQVRARGDEQGAGDEPERRLSCSRLPTSASALQPRTRRKARPPSSKSARLSSRAAEENTPHTTNQKGQPWQTTTFSRA